MARHGSFLGRAASLAALLSLLGPGCGARSHPTAREDGGAWDGSVEADGSRGRDGAAPDAGTLDGGEPPDAARDAEADASLPPRREVSCELGDTVTRVGTAPAGAQGTALVGSRLGETAMLVFGWREGGRLRMRSQSFDLRSFAPRGRPFDIGEGVPADMAASPNFAGSGFAAHLLLEEHPDGRYDGTILSPRGAVLDPVDDPFPLDNVDPPVLALASRALLIAWNRTDEVAVSVFGFRMGASETFSLPFADAPIRPSAAAGTRLDDFRLVGAAATELVRAEVDLRTLRSQGRILLSRRPLAVRSAPAEDWALAALVQGAPEGSLIALDTEGRRHEAPAAPLPPRGVFDAAGHGEGDLLAAFADDEGALRIAFLHGPGRERTGEATSLPLTEAGRILVGGPVVLPIPGTDFGYGYAVFALLEEPDGAGVSLLAERVLCPLPPWR